MCQQACRRINPSCARGHPPPSFNPPFFLSPTPHPTPQDAEKPAPFLEELNDTPSTRRIETPAQRGARRRTTAVTNAAFIVERIDENVLPGSYVAISSSQSGLNGVGLTKLSQITLWRGVTQVSWSGGETRERLGVPPPTPTRTTPPPCPLPRPCSPPWPASLATASTASTSSGSPPSCGAS